MIEPKKVSEALEDPFWIDAMQDELLQFEGHRFWTLVPLPETFTFKLKSKIVMRNHH